MTQEEIESAFAAISAAVTLSNEEVNPRVNRWPDVHGLVEDLKGRLREMPASSIALYVVDALPLAKKTSAGVVLGELETLAFSRGVR